MEVMVVTFCAAGRCWRARPRSPRRACASASRKMLLGLMSRCRICAVCGKVRGMHTYGLQVCCRMLLNIAWCCSVSSHTPGACVLQGRAYAGNRGLSGICQRNLHISLQHNATHYTLQHTAAHCNTGNRGLSNICQCNSQILLQHTATHCNTGN